MNRRAFLQAAVQAGGMLALSGCTATRAFPTPSAARTSTSRRPNILLILADDMGFSDLGCYGSEIATPSLDRLAADGLRFTQMYNCARCCPTRAALLTGLHPHQAGVGHMDRDLGRPAYQGRLNDQCVTLAEVLRTTGYRTLMSGKWHVGRELRWGPYYRGFDEHYGLLGGGANYWGGGGMPAVYARNDAIVQPQGHPFYITDAFTDYALEFLEQPRPAGQPFFLYLAYTAPHWPLHAFPEDIAKYRHHYRIGWQELRRRRHRRMLEMGLVDPRWPLPPLPPEARDWGQVNQDEMDLRMAVYAAQVDRMDQGIGRVLEKLRQLGEEENTLVIFLSDNGGSAEARENKSATAPSAATGTIDSFVSYGREWAAASNTPFRRYKYWVHEGGISTPFIARWPGVIRRGELCAEPAHVIDLMATFVDVAGASYPTRFNGHDILPMEGRSLLPVFRGRRRQPHPTLCWEHEGSAAVRQGDWKLVSSRQGPWELYNLANDRTEMRDLAATEPQRVRELAAAYTQWCERCSVAPFSEVGAGLPLAKPM